MQNLGISVLLSLPTLKRLFEGLMVTLKISFASIIFSVIFGVIIGLIMTSKNKIVSYTFKFLLETIRIVPLLVWLFIFYFELPILFNIKTNNMVISILVFSIWGSFELADLVRSTIESIPKHQMQSSLALGFSKLQTNIYVILPQALIRVVPHGINLFTRIIKTTTLLTLIGVIELLKTGQQIIEVSLFNNPTASFWVYGFIFIIYFAICYPISKFSKKLENNYSM